MAGRGGRRIGLLGGSFNPAHGGHLRITRLALRLLGLDEVWWLVSPQNPLKPDNDMAPYAQRLAGARKLAAGVPIRVSDFEARVNSRFTIDTLRMLRKRHRKTRFVWIMGADNLIQLPRWRRWSDILHTMPVAVFARPTYSYRALAGRVAHRFASCRMSHSAHRRLVDQPPPAWMFLWAANDPASASALRDADACPGDGK
jgi:nicotinate-nucleotide adenylyltransferase